MDWDEVEQTTGDRMVWQGRVALLCWTTCGWTKYQVTK
jgi:hypothetical protein